MIFIVRVCDWEWGNPGPTSGYIVAVTTVERARHVSGVNVYMSMESFNEGWQIGLGDFDIFVFALIDCAFDTIGLVIVHGIADGESTH